MQTKVLKKQLTNLKTHKLKYFYNIHRLVFHDKFITL